MKTKYPASTKSGTNDYKISYYKAQLAYLKWRKLMADYATEKGILPDVLYASNAKYLIKVLSLPSSTDRLTKELEQRIALSSVNSTEELRELLAKL